MQQLRSANTKSATSWFWYLTPATTTVRRPWCLNLSISILLPLLYDKYIFQECTQLAISNILPRQLSSAHNNFDSCTAPLSFRLPYIALIPLQSSEDTQKYHPWPTPKCKRSRARRTATLPQSAPRNSSLLPTAARRRPPHHRSSRTSLAISQHARSASALLVADRSSHFRRRSWD